jgi:hypothetical protein
VDRSVLKNIVEFLKNIALPRVVQLKAAENCRSCLSGEINLDDDDKSAKKIGLESSK